jgi:hypothetical protein
LQERNPVVSSGGVPFAVSTRILAYPLPDPPYSNPVPAFRHHADADHQQLVIVETPRRSERPAGHFDPFESFCRSVEQAAAVVLYRERSGYRMPQKTPSSGGMSRYILRMRKPKPKPDGPTTTNNGSTAQRLC